MTELATWNTYTEDPIHVCLNSFSYNTHTFRWCENNVLNRKLAPFGKDTETVVVGLLQYH